MSAKRTPGSARQPLPELPRILACPRFHNCLAGRATSSVPPILNCHCDRTSTDQTATPKLPCRVLEGGLCRSLSDDALDGLEHFRELRDLVVLLTKPLEFNQ